MATDYVTNASNGALVDHAILVGVEVGGKIGSRFLAADVDPPAEGFYERCGFTARRLVAKDAVADEAIKDLKASLDERDRYRKARERIASTDGADAAQYARQAVRVEG